MLLQIVLVVGLIRLNYALEEGDPCDVVSLKGRCQPYSKCTTLRDAIQQNLMTRNQIAPCGLNAWEEMICCPILNQFTNFQPNPPSTPSTPKGPAVDPALIDEIFNKDPGNAQTQPVPRPNPNQNNGSPVTNPFLNGAKPDLDAVIKNVFDTGNNEQTVSGNTLEEHRDPKQNMQPANNELLNGLIQDIFDTGSETTSTTTMKPLIVGSREVNSSDGFIDFSQLLQETNNRPNFDELLKNPNSRATPQQTFNQPNGGGGGPNNQFNPQTGFGSSPQGPNPNSQRGFGNFMGRNPHQQRGFGNNPQGQIFPPSGGFPQQTGFGNIPQGRGHGNRRGNPSVYGNGFGWDRLRRNQQIEDPINNPAELGFTQLWQQMLVTSNENQRPFKWNGGPTQTVIRPLQGPKIREPHRSKNPQGFENYFNAHLVDEPSERYTVAFPNDRPDKDPFGIRAPQQGRNQNFDKDRITFPDNRLSSESYSQPEPEPECHRQTSQIKKFDNNPIAYVNEKLRRQGLDVVEGVLEKYETSWQGNINQNSLNNFSGENQIHSHPSNNKGVVWPNTWQQNIRQTTPPVIRPPSTNEPRFQTERPAAKACAHYIKNYSPPLTPHILGGIPAEEGEFPHMAALGYPSEQVGKVFDWNCGGSLIDARFVLTAAHCVYRKELQPKIVRLGTINLKDSNTNAYQDIEIKKIHLHPNYTSFKIYDDIALIELKTSPVLSVNVRPACLLEDLANLPNGTVYTICGFGKFKKGPSRLSDILLRAHIELEPLDVCNRTYTQYTHLKSKLDNGLRENHICAMDREKGADACEGDSGGPLSALYDQTRNLYRLVGVVSTGFVCGSTTPGIYARVSSYLDFIEEIVWKADFVP